MVYAGSSAFSTASGGAPPWRRERLLTPPYGEFIPVRDQAPPLGTIICADATQDKGTELASICSLIRARLLWPWCVPCLLARERSELVDFVVDVVPCVRGCVALSIEPPWRHPSRAHVLAAVRAREAPSAETLAGYVSRRVRRDDLLDPLSRQFRWAVDGVPDTSRSLSTYSRLFSRVGCFTARDWRTLAQMALLAGGRAHGSPAPVEPRTIDARARRLLRRSWRSVSALAGWEWVLELALRVGGYVSDPANSIRGS